MMNPPVNRGRRAVISAAIIAYCLALVTYLALQHDTTPLGEIVVKGLFSLAELVTMFYIGGSVVDSTNVAGVIAAKLGQQPQPVYQEAPQEASGGVSLGDDGQPEPVEEEAPVEPPKRRQKRT